MNKVFTPILASHSRTSLARGYESYQVLTFSGKSHVGVVSQQSVASITLRSADRAEIVISLNDIDQLESAKISVMPQGLDRVLSVKELSDLIGSLKTLR